MMLILIGNIHFIYKTGIASVISFFQAKAAMDFLRPLCGILLDVL
jgi:hypothetical protein